MMEEYFPPEQVKEILSAIKDGFLFERLAQELLSHRMGYKFIPAGGIHDRGIDGLDYCSEVSGSTKNIYQISIDKIPDQKIRRTVNALTENKLSYTVLYYITNQKVEDQDIIIDKYYGSHTINLRIFDIDWLAANINHSPATRACLKNFTIQHAYKTSKPGQSIHVSDYVSHPDLYVFLMQQIGEGDDVKQTNEKVIESLILYSLRDTDPDKKILMSKDEIKESVKSFLDFEMERLESKINKRLRSLSSKERKRVNHHTNIDKYCLPYATRLEIMADNARDETRYNSFMTEAEEIIRKNLNGESIELKDVTSLLKKTLEKIFYHQGLEFSDFLLNNGTKDSFESNLSNTVSEILQESKIENAKYSKVANALVLSIRDLMYGGSVESKDYLRALSKTYQMLFLLKCEPKIVDFFQSMAGDMRIFVCTSILVPALSEIYLEDQNKRYWSLLRAATSRGVRLIVNDSIISELNFHIKRSIHIYRNDYEAQIEFYAKEAPELIDQILIRAYAYSVKQGKKGSYYDFISNFITINGSDTQQELIDFLHAEFGIEYMSDQEIGAIPNPEDFTALYNELKIIKKSDDKARTDASLILTIYAMRDKSGERKSSLQGYKTWWLSSDTMTHRTISRIFKEKYPVSCYMRPDFLYNYITFTPSKEKVNQLYKNTFPNLLGVQISNHIPEEIAINIRKSIKDHSEQMNSRIKSKIRYLVDQLKANPEMKYREELKSFFQEQ